MKQPLMGSRQDQQYRQLEEWVAIVTGKPVPDDDSKDFAKAVGDAAAKRTTAAQRRSKLSSIKTAKAEPKPFHLDDTQLAKPIGAAATGDVADAQQPATKTGSGVIQASDEEPLPFEQLRQRKRPAPAAMKSWEPKDAFDPDIFNRQSGAAGSATSSSATPAVSAVAQSLIMRRRATSRSSFAASLVAWALVARGLRPWLVRRSCRRPVRHHCRSSSRPSCSRSNGPIRNVRSRSNCTGNRPPAGRSRSRHFRPGSRRRTKRRRPSTWPATKKCVASRASLLRGDRGRSSAASTGPRARRQIICRSIGPAWFWRLGKLSGRRRM